MSEVLRYDRSWIGPSKKKQPMCPRNSQKQRLMIPSALVSDRWSEIADPLPGDQRTLTVLFFFPFFIFRCRHVFCFSRKYVVFLFFLLFSGFSKAAKEAHYFVLVLRDHSSKEHHRLWDLNTCHRCVCLLSFQNFDHSINTTYMLNNYIIPLHESKFYTHSKLNPLNMLVFFFVQIMWCITP